MSEHTNSPSAVLAELRRLLTRDYHAFPIDYGALLKKNVGDET